MAANRLRFAPSPAHMWAAAPATNGNGGSPAPDGAKALVFSPGFVPINALGGTTDVRMSTERAMVASVLCYAAIRYRMQKLVEAPLFIADETAEGEPWVQNHPLAQLLEMPNADQEMQDLLEETHLSLDLTGKSLWVKQEGRLRGMPARLQHFRGDEFTVRQSDGRVYGRFQVSTNQGKREFGPDEVVFFRYPHPTDRWDGLAPTDVALSRLGIESQLVDSIKAGLRNAVVPGLTIVFPEAANLTDEQKAEFRATLAAGYQEARNHGKALVLGGGVTATQNKLGFEGLAGGDLYRECEAAVCIAFQVRPEILAFMIGLENAPWSHMQTAQRLTYDEAIIPLWRRWERTLTRQLLRPIDTDASRQVRFDTTKIRALQDDQEPKARVSLLLKGVATRNQRRQLAGLEPMEDTPGAAPFWDAVEVAAAPVAREAAPTDPAADEKRARATETKGDDTRWAIWDAVTRSHEYGWELAAAAQLEADRAAVLALADATLRPGRKDDDPAGAPPEPSTVEELIREVVRHMEMEAALGWRARVAPLTTASGRAAVERVATEVGIRFDLLQPGLLDYTEREAAWLVTEVTETTKQEIRSALVQGLEAGESIPQLRARIEQSGAFSRTRAELIARTETTRVANGAARESLSAYQATSGDGITKRWLTAQDARVRDAHRALDGEVRPVDAAFSNGLQQPGEPNCRCTLVYEMEGA